MQAGMQIPQELMKEGVKKTKTDGVQAIGLKSAIKKEKQLHLRYNPTAPLPKSGCFAIQSL
eukprot:7061440-Prymnesium_polylepis.1